MSIQIYPVLQSLQPGALAADANHVPVPGVGDVEKFLRVLNAASGTSSGAAKPGENSSLSIDGASPLADAPLATDPGSMLNVQFQQGLGLLMVDVAAKVAGAAAQTVTKLSSMS